MKWNRVANERVQPDTGGYTDWKTQIANDCFQRCVYCAIPESSYGGIDNFHVEHRKPRSLFRDLEHVISNLFLACAICNRFKRDDWPGEPLEDHSQPAYPDPSTFDYNELFEINPDTYRVSGQFPATTYLTEKLYLNRPQLLIERRSYFLNERIIRLERSIRRSVELLRASSLPEANDLLGRLVTGLIDLSELKRTADTARPYEREDVRRP